MPLVETSITYNDTACNELMAKLTWSSLPAGFPTFNVFRRDDTVVRTLQGSQVAVYEYRTAYDNLLAATKLERESWERDKADLEDEVRSLEIRNAETERRLKGLLSKLRKGLLASEEALSKLDFEHQLLQQSSEETTNSLLQRVDDLQREVAELQAESRSLQTELASVQTDAAMRDAAMQQAAELETAMAALQERARHMVAHLEHEKASAERRVGELESTLSAAQQQLAREAQARATSDSTALRLALERQQLLSALEVERLINEPLRHTHYANTTTLAHVMHSPVAPTVRDRSGNPQPPATPSSPPVYVVPRDLAALTGLHSRPQSAPNSRHGRPQSAPNSIHLSAAASTPASVASSKIASVPSRDVNGSSAFSLTPAGVPAGPRLSPATLTGRNLTRLGRAWATTTAAAGLPNPYFLDNLHSPISPPPPGPPRRARRPAATATTSPPASIGPSPPLPAQMAAAAAASATGSAPGSASGGSRSGDGLLRSPQTPGGASLVRLPEAGGGSTTRSGSWAVAEEATVSPRGWVLGGGAYGFGEPGTPLRVPLVGAAGVMTGRQAMRASMKRDWGSGGVAGTVGSAGGTPATMVYA